MQQFLLFYQKTDTKFNWIHIVQTSISNYYNNISFVESLFKIVVVNRYPIGTNRQKVTEYIAIRQLPCRSKARKGTKHAMYTAFLMLFAALNSSAPAAFRNSAVVLLRYRCCFG